MQDSGSQPRRRRGPVRRQPKTQSRRGVYTSIARVATDLKVAPAGGLCKADASALETLKSMAYTSPGAKSLHTSMRTGPGMARPWEACPAMV
eukprot:365773-Chlamydomonas_euryale.AAC.1